MRNINMVISQSRKTSAIRAAFKSSKEIGKRQTSDRLHLIVRVIGENRIDLLGD